MMFYEVLSSRIFVLGSELPGTLHLLSKQVEEFFICREGECFSGENTWIWLQCMKWKNCWVVDALCAVFP